MTTCICVSHYEPTTLYSLLIVSLLKEFMFAKSIDSTQLEDINQEFMDESVKGHNYTKYLVCYQCNMQFYVDLYR